MNILIVLPILNEAENCPNIIRWLRPYAGRCRVVFVDGGSNDGGPQALHAAGYEVITAPPGRARQMNAGMLYARADVYWFLHADCVPPPGALRVIKRRVRDGYDWGRFNARLSGAHWAFRVIERMMNWRSCLTGVATGDQGIFASARLLREVGGVPDIALMEDIALSKLLRRRGRCACLRERIIVSSRKWERQGIARVTLLMWWLRFRYVTGAAPADLARRYYGGRGV